MASFEWNASNLRLEDCSGWRKNAVVECKGQSPPFTSYGDIATAMTKAVVGLISKASVGVASNFAMTASLIDADILNPSIHVSQSESGSRGNLHKFPQKVVSSTISGIHLAAWLHFRRCPSNASSPYITLKAL